MTVLRIKGLQIRTAREPGGQDANRGGVCEASKEGGALHFVFGGTQ
jgi:hypothetical protein